MPGHPDPSPELRPLPADRYADWLDGAVERYADYLVAVGRSAANESLNTARRTHAQLLPRGLQTPGHHLFEIPDGKGRAVDSAWLHLGAQGRAHLYDLHVDAAHRRLGHARRALTALVRHACALGANQLSLNVQADNVAAHGLYQALGFETHSLQMSRRLARDEP